MIKLKLLTLRGRSYLGYYVLSMLLLIGLGNPGERYNNTRHNVGFTVLDQIAEQYNITFKHNAKFQADVATADITTNLEAIAQSLRKILLVKPQTFMNLSGEAVNKVCAYYKVNPQNVFVIHDDLDLPLGKIKIKLGGGHGGHNGLKSLDRYITNNYYRVRIGIGRPQLPQIEVADYVLGKFLPVEHVIIQEQAKRISQNINPLLEHDVEKFKKLICNV